MAELARVGNWVGELTTTLGIGDIDLGGALDGFAKFSSIGDGEVYYAIVEGNDREAGKGIITGSVLQRIDVYSTLVDGSYDEDSPQPIDLKGLANVFCTFNERAFRELNQTALTTSYDNSISGAASDNVGEALDQLFESAGIPDADVDGKTYGRKDADWIEIISGFEVDKTPPSETRSLHPNDSFTVGLAFWDTGSAIDPLITDKGLYLSSFDLVKLSNNDVGQVSNGDIVRLSIDVKEVTNFSPSFLCADGSNVPDISEFLGVAVEGVISKDVIVTDASSFLPKLKCGFEGSITIAYFKAEKIGQPSKAVVVAYNESDDSYSTVYVPTEAAKDDKQYVRKNEEWEELDIPESGIEEAPEDGNQYTRKDANWEELNVPESGIEEAPIDGKQYARKDGEWESNTPIEVVAEFPASPNANTLYIKVI